MKFNIKSRKGYTLIELLVVIGILAVLAAIAIPSIAGLIDRANKASDETNRVAMIEAIERFTSEYELYRQDVASGLLKLDKMDSVQGRVYNVVQVSDRDGIKNLEKDSSAGPDTEGRAIYRDTKYPVNAETLKAVVESYTKTSSATFEPKQSNMHFWYSPMCGTVITASPASTIAEKNAVITSGTDVKGRELDDTNEIWIDITMETSEEEVDLSDVDPVLANNSWATIHKVVTANKVSEVGWNVGDISPKFWYNGNVYTAMLIGINQDGNKTATFAFANALAERHDMSPNGGNVGGFAASEMNRWLNNDVYNGLSEDVRSVIASVTKYSSLGYGETTNVSSQSYYLFLPSVKELGMADYQAEHGGAFPYIDAESNFVYEYFQTNTYEKVSQYAFGGYYNEIWLRTAHSDDSMYTTVIAEGRLNADFGDTGHTKGASPLFVVGENGQKPIENENINNNYKPSYNYNASELNPTGITFANGNTTPEYDDVYEYGDYIYTYTVFGNEYGAATLEEAREIFKAQMEDSANMSWDKIVEFLIRQQGFANEEEIFIYGAGLDPESFEPAYGGWAVTLNTSVTNTNKTTYGQILETINGKPILVLDATFQNCRNLTTAPIIPSGVQYMWSTFMGCSSLNTYAGSKEANGSFYNYPLPNGLIDISYAFYSCTDMKTAPKLPESVQCMKFAFYNSGIKEAPTIPSSVVQMQSTFAECDYLTGTIIINVNKLDRYDKCFYKTSCPIILVGSANDTILEKLADTANNDNVGVRELKNELYYPTSPR